MESSIEGGKRISDEELLRTVGEDLRRFYADIIRQPLPPKIEAALARIDQAQSPAGSLGRPASHRVQASPRV